MIVSKKLLVLSAAHSPKSIEGSSAQRANELTARLGWKCEPVRGIDELRGRLASGDADLVLLEGIEAVRRMLEDRPVSEETSLAEVEKRHILFVLGSTNGNKTAAARVLGIDTKTLYNKLKSYTLARAMPPPQPQSRQTAGAMMHASGR
jgi:DNA-binding NtrC family response regulator